MGQLTRREMLWAGAGLALAGCGVRDARRGVRYAHWGSPGDDGEFARLAQRLYREFEAEHPGIRLDVEMIPGSQEYLRKILLGVIARSEPDVITLDASSAAVFVDQGAVQDLAGALTEAEWSAYAGSGVAVAARGTARYAVPLDMNPLMVNVNRRVAQEELPREWDLDGFRWAAKRLTEGDRYGFALTNWMPGWVPFLWNAGGDVLSPDGTRATGFFDGPGSRAAFQLLVDLVTKDRSAPTLSQTAAMGVDLFATDRAALKVSGQWEMVGLAGAGRRAGVDYGVVPLPTNLEAPVTVAYQAGLSVGRHCRDLESALAFIRWFTSEAVQLRYQASGVAVSARRAVAERLAKGSAEKEAFLAAAEGARVPWGARVKAYDQIERLGQEAMDAVLTHGVAVDEALGQAAEAMDEVLRA